MKLNAAIFKEIPVLFMFSAEFCDFPSTQPNSVLSHFEPDATTLAFDVIFVCNDGFRSDESNSSVTTYRCREGLRTDADFKDCYSNCMYM